MVGRRIRRAGVVLVAWVVAGLAGLWPAPAPAQVPGSSTPPVLGGVDLETATIPDLQAAMDAGRISSARLTDLYLDRIARVDPWLRSVVNVNPDAARQAARSDRRRARGARSRVLEGIPVLLKDNIDTADRQPTTVGSLAMTEARPARDAGLVRRLRRAGAVLLGKANLSEWANFRSTESLSGWSAVRGQNVNPYVLDRSPCGSSSGSAVAVAAHLATVSVGTETWGSITCPAGTNGVVGIKPTVGLVSRGGVAPISAEQDTPGPFARNVTDAAITLEALQGTEARDRATRDARPYVHRRYGRGLRADALRGRRIGVWRSGEGADVERVLDASVAALRAAGATPVTVEIDDAPLGEPAFAALLVEFKHDIDEYLAATPGEHPTDLAGLIAFNRRFASLEMPLFGQELFEQSEATGGDLRDPEYLAARRTATTEARRLVDATVAEHDLDAIMAPTNGPAWVITGETTTCTDSGGSSGPAAIGGYPNVTVPAGFACGALPLGVSFFGTRWDEPDVLAIAYAFEQATRARRPPAFLPTLPTDGGGAAAASRGQRPAAR